MSELSKLEKQAFSYLLAREQKYSQLIQKQLRDSLNIIYAEMKVIYDKYAINGKLTKVEMTRYNKYITMEQQILKKLDPAIKANIKEIKYLLPSQYQESFFHYAWAIDNATGLRLSYGNINTSQFLQLFDITNPKNIELQNALINYPLTAKKAIRAALLNNLSIGKTFDEMARDLRKALSITFNDALRIVRTEGISAINAGQTLAYIKAQENGVMGVEKWSATKDSKTRYDHAIADGKKRNEDGYFYVGGEPALYPGDPNLSAGNRIHCRCHTYFEIEGYEPQLMRTREEGILPYMTYNDYAKQYHPDWLKKGA
jgi:hypothetical protein